MINNGRILPVYATIKNLKCREVPGEPESSKNSLLISTVLEMRSK
jgi:hypothetical protein